MQADQRLTEAYKTAQAKPDGDAALAALRAGQLRWLRVRNRCESQGCVAEAYARRIAELQASNRRVLALDGKAFVPVFSRTLAQVNDTRAVHGIPLRRAQRLSRWSCSSTRKMPGPGERAARARASRAGRQTGVKAMRHASTTRPAHGAMHSILSSAADARASSCCDSCWARTCR
jgi:hypothetical protein